jgi:hypothetical protein
MSRSREQALHLTGIDGDFAAAHVREILAASFDSLLVIAVNGERFFEAIQTQFPQADITLRPAQPGSLPPLPDAKFDAVICFDLLSTLPKSKRASAWSALDQRAGKQSLFAEPLGTDLQQMIFRSLLEFIRERELPADPVMINVLREGLPVPEETLSWPPDHSGIELCFAGDVNYFRTAAERSIAAAGKSKLFGLLLQKAGLDNPEGGATDLEPETVPMRRHRRLYLHRTKG